MNKYFSTGLAVSAVILLMFVVVGCTPPKPELPPTELPELPASADKDCEQATDAEIIECIKNPNSRDVCRKLEISCARYDDLKKNIKRIWSKRDGK